MRVVFIIFKDEKMKYCSGSLPEKACVCVNVDRRGNIPMSFGCPHASAAVVLVIDVDKQ